MNSSQLIKDIGNRKQSVSSDRNQKVKAIGNSVLNDRMRKTDVNFNSEPETSITN